MSTLSGGPNVVVEGLVLWLDAANSKSYVSDSTTWNDISRSGNNGTLINGPTFNSSNGGSIVFDGVDDYVSSFSSPISVVGSRTISCFFKTAITTRNGLCGNRDANPTGFVFTVNRTTPGNLTYFHTGGSEIEIAAGISINTWCNACVTYDVSTTTATLYLNGVQIGIPTSSFSSMTPSSFNGVIGNEASSLAIGEAFNGNIAQVSIYNRALTTQEITQNFNALKGRYGL